MTWIQSVLLHDKTPKSSDSGVLVLFFFFVMVQNGIEDDGKQACNDDTVLEEHLESIW